MSDSKVVLNVKNLKELVKPYKDHKPSLSPICAKGQSAKL